jgi:hypothetical protein
MRLRWYCRSYALQAPLDKLILGVKALGCVWYAAKAGAAPAMLDAKRRRWKRGRHGFPREGARPQAVWVSRTGGRVQPKREVVRVWPCLRKHVSESCGGPGERTGDGTGRSKPLSGDPNPSKRSMSAMRGARQGSDSLYCRFGRNGMLKESLLLRCRLSGGRK